MKKSLFIMKKRWLAVFCSVFFAAFIMAAADTKAADETGVWEEGKQEVYTEGAFTYYIHPSQSGEEAWVYKIEVKGKGKSLFIPESILGKKVTRLGRTEYGSEEDDLNKAYATLFGTYIEPWHDWDCAPVKSKALSTLKSVQIPDTVEVIDRASFAGLDSITEIKLPQKVKKIEASTFFGCDRLKTIVLPEQMESFDNSSLQDCPALKKIKLSKTNNKFQVKGNCLIRREDKALVFAAASGKKFKIPGGVKKITSYAFCSATSKVVNIPASVARIEGQAFHMQYSKENMNIRDVTVSKKNRVFARDGQCIYRKSDKSLVVAIPDKNGNLRISERVKKLTPEISLINCNTWEEALKEVVFPGRLKRVTAPAFGAFHAKKVYFTGSVPPKVTEDDEEPAGLPVFCHVYVPKAYEKAYKKWYKKYGYYSHVDGWHTYNP